MSYKIKIIIFILRIIFYDTFSIINYIIWFYKFYGYFLNTLFLHSFKIAWYKNQKSFLLQSKIFFKSFSLRKIENIAPQVRETISFSKDGFENSFSQLTKKKRLCNATDVKLVTSDIEKYNRNATICSIKKMFNKK